MRRSKHISLWIAALTVALIALIVISFVVSKKEKASNTYLTIASVLEDFPNLPTPYTNFVCYFRDGNSEYLLCANGDQLLTGKREFDGNEVYFANGQQWSADNAGSMQDDSAVPDEVVDVVTNAIQDLLDDDVSVTYHKTHNPTLPKWIFPDDPFYIKLIRRNHENRLDVMTNGTGAGESYIRWTITELSPLEKCVLYFYAFEEDISFADIAEAGVRGWGEIPNEIHSLFT